MAAGGGEEVLSFAHVAAVASDSWEESLLLGAAFISVVVGDWKKFPQPAAVCAVAAGGG